MSDWPYSPWFYIGRSGASTGLGTVTSMLVFRGLLATKGNKEKLAKTVRR